MNDVIKLITGRGYGADELQEQLQKLQERFDRKFLECANLVDYLHETGMPYEDISVIQHRIRR